MNGVCQLGGTSAIKKGAWGESSRRLSRDGVLRLEKEF
jgi:hypothetical protein